MESTVVVDLLQAPPDIGEEQYEACRLALIHQVEAGVADPLAALSSETWDDLVALAFHDEPRLDRLELQIQEAIRKANQGDAAARRFKLSIFRKHAKDRRQKINAVAARRAKLAQRNRQVLESSRGDGKLDDIDADLPIDVQSDLYSESLFLQACGFLRSSYKGRLWFDDFHNSVWSDWDGGRGDQVVAAKAVDDATLLAIYATMLRSNTRLAKLGYQVAERAIHKVAFEDRRHEPRDWLKGLKWDGVERLPGLLSKAYGTPDDEYHRAVGRCWFVSMAARIMKAGEKVHTMPVFVGPQGAFKSSALEIIGGKWYRTINVAVDKGNDFQGSLAGTLVAEIAELDAFRRGENSRIKTLLSTSEDAYRPPYGRTVQTFRRTAVLAGTTNESGWHRDESGARRFWTVMVGGGIDLSYLSENREQLFAEALARHQRGESWFDVPREEQERLAMEHFAAHPWEERIEQAIRLGIENGEVYTGAFDDAVRPAIGDPTALDQRSHWGTLVTTSRVMTQWLQLPNGQQGRVSALEVARIMRKLGWEHGRVRGAWKGQIRAWTVTRLLDACGLDTRQKELSLQ